MTKDQLFCYFTYWHFWIQCINTKICLVLISYLCILLSIMPQSIIHLHISFTALVVKKTQPTSKSPQPKKIYRSLIQIPKLKTHPQTCQNPRLNPEQPQPKSRRDVLQSPIKIWIIWKNPLMLEQVQKMNEKGLHPQIHRDWAEMHPKTMVKMKVQIGQVSH